MPPLRLAIVGCGLAAERLHGPALRGFDGFAPTVMVDRDASRAALLASFFPGAETESDYRQLAGKVDAAIVALPSNLNAVIATDLLNMGISVLVEKPAALTVAEAQALAAAEGKASLAVGFIRREAAAVRMAKACLDSGMLGTIRKFSLEDGYPFHWTGISDFRFDPNRGGGILLDIGTHVLDTAAYWFGDIKVTACHDDNRGGVETDVRIALEAPGGIPGTAELSWNRTLRNTARIIGDKGTLEVEWYRNVAKLTLSGDSHSLDGVVLTDPALAGGGETFPLMFLAQLQRWHDAVRSGDSSAMAGAAEALRNVELITSCRERRADMAMPWRLAEAAA
jgi:predicted dehydrogenase